MAEAAQARTAADSLSAALERSDFVGWDPYDALASPGIRAVARTPLLRQAAIQGLKILPFNPRRVLGVPAKENPKALALFVSAYARLARLEPDGRFAGLALALAERLEAARSAFGRRGRLGLSLRRADALGLLPGHAAERGRHVVRRPRAHGRRWRSRRRAVSRAAVDSALAYATLAPLVEEGEEAFFAYYDGSRVPIHNASLLVASMFARREHEDDALPALRYSLARQRPDGSWPYGERSGLDWVDGYHTAFVLWSLGRRSIDKDDGA